MSERPVAVDADETARNENLPLSLAAYPSHYGTFIGFKTDRSELQFCSCAREAIENYIRYEYRNGQTSSYDVSPEKVVEDDFPEEFQQNVQTAEISDIKSIIDLVNFEDRICHKCNEVVPNRRYCVDMYGTVFEQNYGWYINQKQWEYGAPQTTLRSEFAIEFLDYLPEDVIDIIDVESKSEIETLSKEFTQLDQKRSRRKSIVGGIRRAEMDKIRDKQQSGELSFGEARERRREMKNKFETDQVLPLEEHNRWNQLQDELLEYGQTISEAAENEVRRAVGHYEKGNRWTSETILFQLVKADYGSEYTLKRHHRPDWLEGLELDIFIVEANIGIEYQGIQHYEAIEHWGGEEALNERQERDKRKKEICDEHGVEIIEVRHDEELSEDLVKSKIEPLINS
jgi:hypothetical protein